jgi:hypothetical protein
MLGPSGSAAQSAATHYVSRLGLCRRAVLLAQTLAFLPLARLGRIRGGGFHEDAVDGGRAVETEEVGIFGVDQIRPVRHHRGNAVQLARTVFDDEIIIRFEDGVDILEKPGKIGMEILDYQNRRAARWL